jgi:hypothetical protein
VDLFLRLDEDDRLDLVPHLGHRLGNHVLLCPKNSQAAWGVGKKYQPSIGKS